MNAGGPPPPPPPPPIPGIIPSLRLPSEIPDRPAMNNPPAALASAMMKDRKPFTYTPGGLDLSEISNQYPNQNGDQASNSAEFGEPVQSRSFRVLQNVLETQDNADSSPTSGAPMKIEVPLGAPRPYSSPQNSRRESAPKSSLEKRGSLFWNNGQRDLSNGPRGSFSQTANGNVGTVNQSLEEKRGSVPSISKNQAAFNSRPNGYRGSVGNIRNTYNQDRNMRRTGSENDGLTIIQNSVGGVSKIILGPNVESEPLSPNAKELSNIFKDQVRISANTDEARTRGGHFPKESFNPRQKNEPQGPIHIPKMKHAQPPNQYQPQPNQYQQQPQKQYVFQQPPGVNNNPANPEQTAPEPKKYMGGSIPSRSFRMLQAMTGSDDATGPGDPANSSESSSQPEDDTQHTANQIPSPNCKSSVPTSPTSLSPSHVSSDSGISSPSKIGPYATGKDSRVYRHVSPVVNLNGSKERVVNSALSNAPSSPTWKIESPQPTDIIRTVDYSSTNSENEGSPRLMGILRDESVSPNPQNVEKRYEGGYIPSRVFRHLHAEYSGDSNELQDHRGQHSMKSPSPRYDGSPIPPRVLKSIQNEANSSFDSDTTDGENPSRASSSLAELDEYYHNGIARTAVTKDTVLKELAAQFDHAGTRKKPKAAPGRVFRYLQSQYDTPDDSVDQQQAQQRKNDLQPETQEVSGLGYQRSNVPSPSFKFLQSQYKQPEQSQPTKSTPQSSSSNTMEGKLQAFSNSGCRVPGRTFKSLQDNVATHPSVFKPRK